MKRGLIFFILILPFCLSETYYVSTASCSDSGPGSFDQPWCTIQHAADTMSAGDTVYVGAGTYSEVVSAANSANAGNTITFVADGAVTVNGWVVTGDYVRIIGFIIEGANIRADGIYVQNADYCEIWNNRVQNFLRDAIRTDSGGRDYQSNNCIFVGNTIINSGLKNFQIRGNNNLAEYNEFSEIGSDGFYLFGGWNIIRNNYAHDMNADPSAHTDFLQSGDDSALGLHDCLYEANMYLDTAGSDHHGSNMETNNPSNDANHVSRRNVWYNHGSYGYGFSGSSYDHMYFYNEHCIGAMRYWSNNDYGDYMNGDYINSFNNIFYNWWGDSANPIYVYSYDGSGHTSEYNLGFNSGGTRSFGGAFGNDPNTLLNVNPNIANVAGQEFYLLSSSPARDAGGALTKTSGSGTGTTFNVLDAGFFRGDDTAINQYEGNLVVGDTITVGTDVVIISSISGNAITTTSSFTWSDNDPVYFGADTTPDIGALPYKANGYSITNSLTYETVSQGILFTASVDDPSLVRRVEFWTDGLPVAMNNYPPYEYTWDTSQLETGSNHRIEAIARPLYADSTLGYSDYEDVVIGEIQEPVCGDGNCDASEDCTTCEIDCGVCPCTPIHDADNNPCDGSVSTEELSAYINEWKAGTVAIQNLMGAIAAWKGK